MDSGEPLWDRMPPLGISNRLKIGTEFLELWHDTRAVEPPLRRSAASLEVTSKHLRQAKRFESVVLADLVFRNTEAVRQAAIKQATKDHARQVVRREHAEDLKLVRARALARREEKARLAQEAARLVAKLIAKQWPEPMSPAPPGRKRKSLKLSLDPPMNQATSSPWLKMLRREAGLYPEGLANRLGVTLWTVLCWESGAQPISPREAAAIHAALRGLPVAPGERAAIREASPKKQTAGAGHLC